MFNFRCLSKNRGGGFSLIEVLVTIAILSIGVMALTQWQVTGMKANKSASIRLDVMDVKRTITNSLSCDKTFESFGATRPIACNVAVTLKNKNGNSLTNNGKIGAWTIEASCETIGSPAVNGLSIYATQPGKRDPLRNIALDKTHPIASLFSPEVRLCKDHFEAAPSGGSNTPGGKCKTYKSPWNRHDSDVIVSGGTWVTKRFICPIEFPVAMSVQSQPACNASAWQGAFLDSNNVGYFNSVACSVLFADGAAASACWAGGGNPLLAQCFYACCNL